MLILVGEIANQVKWQSIPDIERHKIFHTKIFSNTTQKTKRRVMITDVNQINYTSKNVHVLKTPKEIAQQVAHRIASLIRQKQTENKQCVLCLPTGSTPVLTYRELIRLHQEEGLSFKNVITFNLDE